MIRFMKKIFRKAFALPLISGIILTILLGSGISKVYKVTSTDRYCISCHIHTEADMAWKWSTHSDNPAGMKVHCVDCHLPVKDNLIKYSFHKAKHGIKDVYGFYFKDSSDFDWAARSSPEIAAGFVYKESCLKCHTNMTYCHWRT